MSSVLLIPLVGPMQSWGTRSRFQERDTEREPSKSGVIGLLCAALGRDRSAPLDDLTVLKMGVRVDQEGYLTKDFQTAQNVAKASDSGTEDLISNRYYLSDASFLIGLEGDDAKWLRHLHSALATPVWMLFLGRKSYVPSLPLYLPDGFIEDSDLRSALLNYPLLFRSKQQKNIRIILESSSVTHESRMDTPVSFAHGRREFRERFVKMEFLPAETLAFEGGYLCI